MAYDSYLVREEDGTSHYLLEDGSGALILETAVEISSSEQQTTTGGSPTPLLTIRELPDDDEDAIALVLALL